MNKKTLAAVLVIAVAALSRLLPHLPNFTPLAAIALFSGAYIANRYLAFAMPILAMLISDAIMGFNGWAFPEQVITVYATYIAITGIGLWLNNNKSLVRVGVSTFASSVLFFITTNFAVWMGGFFHQPPLYPVNGAGLVECFVAAVPFFQYTAAGDLLYSTLLFGGFYLLQINIPALSRD